jgi:hypothetical protein
MHKVVLVTDPDSGYNAVYLDGELFWDFDEEMFYTFSIRNDRQISWIDCLYDLFPKIGAEFESQGRHMLTREIKGFDWTDYETYWPLKLEDAPVDDYLYEDAVELDLGKNKVEFTYEQ